MLIRKSSLLISTLILSFISFNTFAHKPLTGNSTSDKVFKIYADSDSAPYNYINKHGQIVGLSIDIVNQLLKDAKFKYQNVKILPWARAFNATLNNPNSMILTMYKTEQRKDLFDWIGPYTASYLTIIAKKDKIVPKKDPIIATLRGSSLSDDLKKQKFTNKLIQVNDYHQGMNLLIKDRVDGWALPKHTATDLLKSKNLDLSDFYVYKTITINDLYFGINKNTDPKIKEHLQNSFIKIKNSGILQDMVYHNLTHSNDGQHDNEDHLSHDAH